MLLACFRKRMSDLRAKMPSHEETVVPWHQDNSYWEPRIWGEQVLTVWVALVDATEERCDWRSSDV